jgi:hypothetical protein
MSNRIIEGFDWVPLGLSTGARQTIFAANQFFSFGDIDNNPPSPRTGRFGFGYAVGYNDGGIFDGSTHTKGYVIPVRGVLPEGFIGFSLFRGANSDQGVKPFVGFFDAIGGVVQCSVSFERYGVIRAWRGHPGSGTLLNASPAGSFEEDNWFNGELKGLIANVGGTLELRINTEQKIQIPDADTQNSANANFDSIIFGYYRTTLVGGDDNWAIDDLFMNDLAGTSNNDWSGNLRVKSQWMIANGAVDNFTIGGTSPAATAWQSVLNNSLNDTKYVFSPNIGDQELFTPDPNLNAPIVRAVQVRMGLRQDDATQRSAKALLRLGSTVYESDDEFFTNQTYTMYKGRWDLNPATGVSFTGAEVNASQVGVGVIS